MIAQITIAKLLDEIYVGVSHDHVFKFHNIRVLKLCQDRYFAHCCAWNSVLKIFDFGFLDCESLSCLATLTSVYVSIRTRANGLTHDLIIFQSSRHFPLLLMVASVVHL
jgi:hypothetical protein